jgi:Ca2+-binding RTX toxin-like protein
MTTIGKTGTRLVQLQSRVETSGRVDTAKPEVKARTQDNPVRNAVAARLRDGFDAAPRGAAPQRQRLLGESGAHTLGPGHAHAHGAEGTGKTGANAGLAVGSGPTVTTEQSGRTVVDLGTGSNNATVSQTTDGGLSITSDGKTVTLTAAQAQNAVINGGDGNDTITVDASVKNGVHIDGGRGSDKLTGGEGNDTLAGGEGNDVVIGGKGNDTLSGAAGDDYLEGGAGDDAVNGGDGRDVMYGLDGNDRMSGGAGRDYMDGGGGDDTVNGGKGDDQVMGGRGNDTLQGGKGNDAVAGGLGTDTVDGGEGSIKLYTQQDDKVTVGTGDKNTVVDLKDYDTLGSSISVSGSDEFKARVESDLDAMRSLPIGQDLLRRADGSGKKTDIRATSGGNSAGGTNFSDGYQSLDGKPGKGSDAYVNYNITRISLGGEEWMNRPPVVGFFHELVHTSDINTGTLAPGKTDGTDNLENSAVGLPFDHDGDPKTPKITQNRPAENDLRDQLNLPTRPRY